MTKREYTKHLMLCKKIIDNRASKYSSSDMTELYNYILNIFKIKNIRIGKVNTILKTSDDKKEYLYINDNPQPKRIALGYINKGIVNINKRHKIKLCPNKTHFIDLVRKQCKFKQLQGLELSIKIEYLIFEYLI